MSSNLTPTANALRQRQNPLFLIADRLKIEYDDFRKVMPLINPAVGLKYIFILGITNIVSILLVFFSCRCMVGVKFINKMMQYGWYQKYYRLHCYYWWVFFISVILHTVIAFLSIGNPL